MRFEDTSKSFRLGALLIIGMLSLAGCGDDSAKTGDAGKDAGPADAGPPTTMMCIAQAKANNSKSPQKTIDCLCDKCLQAMTDCNADEGCVKIRDCADRTGCLGNLCYFGQPECMAIIDMYGVQGISTTLATQLNACNDMMCNGGSNKDAGMTKPGKDAGSNDDGGSNDAGH